MIASAKEFARLRTSNVMEEYNRAGTEEAPTKVWLDVLEKFPEMREWVAHNKSVPLEILAILAQDPDERVRGVVAGKRKLSRKLFERLARDSSESVRLGVARNKRVPADVLETLASDGEEFVRTTARDCISKRAKRDQKDLSQA
jgi:hypothetical protein